MTRVVRHLRTKKYFRKGHWTPDRSLADEFEDSLKAINACLAHGIRNVELILQFDPQPNDYFDVRLKLFQ